MKPVAALPQDRRFRDVWKSLVPGVALRWRQPKLDEWVEVRISARLTRSLGRAYPERGIVSVSECVLSDRPLLRHVLCHELAHIVAFRLVGRTEPPHGPTWKRLMAEAGCSPARTIALPPAGPASGKRKTRVRYLHRCPVCQFGRYARRRMAAWRCADCAGAGLDGRLVITRAPAGP